jgi:hypothetical protein
MKAVRFLPSVEMTLPSEERGMRSEERRRKSCLSPFSRILYKLITTN